MKKNQFITYNTQQTQKMGETLAKELRGGEILCLSGELGSGKTTFAQGVLKGLGAKGAYTSPTFVVMKHYKKEIPISKSKFPYKEQSSKSIIQDIYHIDAYRVNAVDIINLGWEEITSDRRNILIVEWAERIRGIIPKRAIWLSFEHSNEHERKIDINSDLKTFDI